MWDRDKKKSNFSSKYIFIHVIQENANDNKKCLFFCLPFMKSCFRFTFLYFQTLIQSLPDICLDCFLFIYFESEKCIYGEDAFKIIILHVRVKLFYYENVGDSNVLFTVQL